MIFSKGKFWKALPKISVKAEETRSLISGRVTIKPGCQAPLMMRSRMPSRTSRPYRRFDMWSFRSRIVCTSTRTLTFAPGSREIVVVCTRSSGISGIEVRLLPNCYFLSLFIVYYKSSLVYKSSRVVPNFFFQSFCCIGTCCLRWFYGLCSCIYQKILINCSYIAY